MIIIAPFLGPYFGFRHYCGGLTAIKMIFGFGWRQVSLLHREPYSGR
jgi:hypothetical protein